MNSFAPIDPALLDVPSPEITRTQDGHGGYTDEMKAEDTVPGALQDACGSASRAFPDALWIEPRDWAEKARENDKNLTWPINYVDRFTNQDPTHECTTHSERTGAEACRNRQIGVKFPEGPKKNFRYEESKQFGSVWLSPLSIYSEANPRKKGGANVIQVLEIAAKRGFLPEKIQPFEYGFEHTLQGTTGRGGLNQSSGPWVSVSRFPEGWKETAKHFKPLEVIFPESYEQAMCLLLHGMVVCVGRDGHAVPWAKMQFSGDQVSSIPYIDSYDVIRFDSVRTAKRAWQGSFAIASMTAPDDWMKPAG